MRPSVRMCALALALAIAAVAAVPPARADMDKPSWNPGDYWVYSATDVGFGFGGSPGTVRYDVLGPDTVNVGGTDYPAYRLKVTANATSSTVTFNAADVWYRTSDLALVQQSWNVTADVPFFGRVIVSVIVTFDPPLGLAWPFTSGKTWSSTTTITTVTTYGGFTPPPITGTLDDDYVVQAATTVTVPAGTFDTTPVRATETGGDYTIGYWSPQAGNAARQQSFDDTDAQLSSQELTSYRYAGSGFLGLPLVVWLLIILVVFLIVLGVVFLRRQRRRGVMLPPTSPPQMPR